jgi:hypothetical protein
MLTFASRLGKREGERCTCVDLKEEAQYEEAQTHSLCVRGMVGQTHAREHGNTDE